MTRLHRMRTLLTLTALLALTPIASAAPVSVESDAALARALHGAKAGDVLQIKPGTYRGGVSATGLRGTKDRPIVIEGADEKDLPVIQGGGSGLQLSDCQYVTVRRLLLRGATGNGLNIDDGGNMDQSSVGIVIEKVRVEDVGPRGNTDGIKLSGLRDFAVRECTVEGWGGNAIDLVGCADGVIEKCTVRGKPGFDCTTGPQLKGGTRDVIVRDCLFDNAGQRAVNAGGSTGLQFFRPLDAAYEAKDLTIENNTFIGSDAPVAFVGIDGAVFRRNTIIDPTRWVLRILQESKDARFARCRNVTFERNLIVYKRATTHSHVNIGGDTEPATFTFKENWWYCSDRPEDRPQLPSQEIDAVVGEDPKVKRTDDGRFLPGNPRARAFGASKRER